MLKKAAAIFRNGKPLPIIENEKRNHSIGRFCRVLKVLEDVFFAWLGGKTYCETSLLVATFGTASDKTVQADYTGDGKADIAFFRPQTREWFVLRSEDFSFYSAPFGAAGDIPTPGDYDGDGQTDFAVYRPSNNTWYCNNQHQALRR